MKEIEAIRILRQFDINGRYVFSTHDMPKLFPDDNPKTLAAGLRRLVEKGILQRACRGVYVNQHAASIDSYTIERIAQALRRSDYNYVSLESVLSEYGVISQIPIDRLTIMTTGREGIYETSYGVIEFTHTKRPLVDILPYIQRVPKRPLRIATLEIAIRDLKRVGRNLHLLSNGVSDD